MSEVSLGSNLNEFAGRARNPVPFLKRVGAMMKGRVKGTFTTQGRDGINWKPRGVPNVIGIIKDMEAGRKSIPKRRFEARPAGIDTRLLSRSINYAVEGTSAVAIGSVVSYATKVQEGGPTTVRVSSMARNNLRGLVEKARKKIAKGGGTTQDQMLAQLGWLLFRSQVKKNVPARPFVFFSDKDRRDVIDMAKTYFGKPGEAGGAVAKA